MEALGLNHIAADCQTRGFFFKCIANHSTAVFFKGTEQHRDVKQAGVSYEDDYAGNALAATITPGRIDIRFHRDYPDAAVREIFLALLALPEMDWAKEFTVRYQGRSLG